jgi:GT2 family glycosyltransferase
MITIVYSTHKDETYNNNFKKHLLQNVGLKNVQILEYQNNNQYSLAEVYNKGISESIYDIVVCCHNDIRLENGWGKKLLKDFSKNPDFSIIGKAGSCYFPISGIYWEKMSQTMVGQVYHEPKGQKKWMSKYSNKFPFLIPVVTIDGLFISFDKTKIKHTFDEKIGKFHFYDHSFCIPNYLDEVKIGVTTSFDVTHESVGQPNQEFYESKDKFLEKWGSKLPLDLKPESVPFEKTTPKKLKGKDKVAVIIPTKGNLHLLFDCINSFYTECDPSNFTIFIADTGSTDDEIIEIEKFISLRDNIKLIKYNYYHFAKINNDVVKNYVSDEFNYLLFCNNDIKILNDIIYKMTNVFNKNNIVGTVGGRLYFGNNTLQHNGASILFDPIKSLISVEHDFYKSYYKLNPSSHKTLGNTGALLMTRHNVFKKLNGFDESFDFWEDFNYCLKCLFIGYVNINEGTSVAYHYESQTRKFINEKSDLESWVKMEKMISDYRNYLQEYIKYTNIEKYDNNWV